MDRRHLLAALAALPCARLLAAQDEAPRPRHKISAAQLYEVLAKRFPVRFGLAGLLELQVDASRLLLLPARNLLGAALQAQVSSPSRQAQPQQGELELVFALRYEPADQTLRAWKPEILDVRWPGLPPDSVQGLQALLPGLAARLGDVVLHRFTPRELALADTMGVQPQELRVVDDGLLVFFGPKPR
jgi:hypothetical protein